MRAKKEEKEAMSVRRSLESELEDAQVNTEGSQSSLSLTQEA